MGSVENLHNLFHRRFEVYAGRRCGHEPAHVHFLVEVWTEHYVAYVVKQHHALEISGRIHHREQVAL